MSCNQITHPETGLTLNQKQWAERLGICQQALSVRLRSLPLEKALTVGRIPKQKPWTEEEEEYLALVYRTPNLLHLWNQHAQKRGWQRRTQISLDDRIKILKDKGLVTNRQHKDCANGWLSESQLADCLGVDRSCVDRWVKGHMLPAYRDRNYSIKIHLQHFISWACSSTGSGLVAKAVSSNAIAINWLLIQTGNWLLAEPPILGAGLKSISRYKKK